MIDWRRSNLIFGFVPEQYIFSCIQDFNFLGIFLERLYLARMESIDSGRLIDIGGYRVDVKKFCPTLTETTVTGIGCNLVQTPSTIDVIHHFVQALLLKVPIIIQGGVGCGKSFLIREMAKVFGQGNSLIELSLDDQADSKTLFGEFLECQY